ncbi:hypothetical protein [Haloplanus rubicundus]|uniref:hypothetical protein n=1 Tax=Haloplanus rubicundus TaxID=1547898 RepID=UPI001300262E|nr:hypothetical protein [Haloplanus rubicundus]
MSGIEDALMHGLIVACFVLFLTDTATADAALVAGGSALSIEAYWEVVRSDA